MYHAAFEGGQPALHRRDYILARLDYAASLGEEQITPLDIVILAK